MIYFDNSSTTVPSKRAVEYINNALNNVWGNPSSLHTLGISAEEILENTRRLAAQKIGALPEEIYFTSGGTEANNIAIFGAANARKKRGNRIVTTAIEHPSVLNCMKHLEKEGFEVIYLMPDGIGVIKEKDIFDAINDSTILVSIMLVNNEIGSIQPLRAAANAIKQNAPHAILHTDAVQAFGKLPFTVKDLGVDLLTASGHKIHASKGVGFLYKAKNLHIESPVYGGGQENGIRSGTEAIPNIAGLLGALEELPDTEKQLIIQKELWHYAKESLKSTGLCQINSSDSCLPYIMNISVLGYRSETLLHFLDSKGIFVSSGSACAKGQKSYVLNALGYSNAVADSALRLSFSRYNTKEEIDKFCVEIANACKTLRKANR